MARGHWRSSYVRSSEHSCPRAGFPTKCGGRRFSDYRRLRIEPLEDRRLLSITVNTNLDVVDANDGLTTLREAISTANATTGAEVIEFDFDHDGPATIYLTNGELEITDQLTIDGVDANSLTIDAQQQSRILNIAAISGDVTIRGLTLTGGQTTGAGVYYDDLTFAGGAIRSFTLGKLTIDGCTISNNRTVGDYAGGGAILSLGELVITSSRVTESSTNGLASYGGAIRSYGPLTLIDSTVTGNRTSSEYAAGGAIYSLGKVKIYDSVISGNRSASNGGGISTVEDMLISNSEINNNQAEGAGGGICSDANIAISDSVISGNSAAAEGGGIYTELSVSLDRCAVIDNRSEGSGGGIRAHESATLNYCTVQGNSTSNRYAAGGGIWADRATITASTISGNSTTGDVAWGGGIACGPLILTLSTVSGNSTHGAGSDGGGIWAYFTSTLTQSTITDNHAVNSSATGGGIWMHSGFTGSPTRTLSLVGSILAGNTASGGNPDVRPVPTVIVRYSLIGDSAGTNLTEAPSGSPDANGNHIGGPVNGVINPLLGPLADNGGPTTTHTVLLGSPAIDTGDPTAVAGMDNVPAYDQRGAPFARVVDGNLVPGADRHGSFGTPTNFANSLRRLQPKWLRRCGRLRRVASHARDDGHAIQRCRRQRQWRGRSG